MGLLPSAEAHVAHELAAFAARRENWQRTAGGGRDAHTRQLGQYRLVFEWWVADQDESGLDMVFRRMTISIRPRRGPLIPTPIVVYTVATWLGFTGATMKGDLAVEMGDDWLGSYDDEELTVVMVQRVAPADVPAT